MTSSGNPTLSDAIQKAKKNSVPNDNIDRAVKRGSGLEAGGADWQTIMYEGYGPSGVAVLIECLTDNRNRAASEVRTAMTRNGGSMADPGLGVLPVQPQGRRARAEGRRPDRGRRAARGAGRRRRGGQRPRRGVRGRQRGRPTWSPCARALQDAGIDYDSADSCFLPSVSVSSSTRTAPARCSGWSTRSRTATTSRTSGPTSTSATRSWSSSASGCWPGAGVHYARFAPFLFTCA